MVYWISSPQPKGVRRVRRLFLNQHGLQCPAHHIHCRRGMGRCMLVGGSIEGLYCVVFNSSFPCSCGFVKFGVGECVAALIASQ